MRIAKKFEIINHLHEIIDHIEAQWQEIQRLRVQMIQAARGSAEIVDLAAENVKLQSQNAVLWEAIEEATETIENIYERDTEQTVRFRKVMEAEPADYHNPADVEALARAREALHQISIIYPGINVAWEALEQIDKAIGGEKNA